MTITTTFDPPLLSDSREVFDAKAFGVVADLNSFAGEANALAADVNAKEAAASAAASAASAAAAAATTAADDAGDDAVAADAARAAAVVAQLAAEAAAAAAGSFDPADYVAKAGATMAGDLTVPSLNGGQLAGLRNKVINGNFGINQRAYVSGAATTAGQYTLDRWKVTGTGGVTFSTAANKTTVTIPSGQTLQQVIEGLNLESGTYVLSWEGTAQGRIAGGSYGASGAVTASITGGTNTTIEFNTGTVALVMLEKGTVATPFEHRLHGMELTLCLRYFVNAANNAFSGVSTSGQASQYVYAVTRYTVPMRAAPTITLLDGSSTPNKISFINASTGATTNNWDYSSAPAGDALGFRFTATTATPGVAGTFVYQWRAEAEL